jgi:DNA-binding NtrC family response regulator
LFRFDIAITAKGWGSMSKGIILCVDDDSTVLNALRTLLSKIFGNDNVVEIAESGEEALEIVQDYASDAVVVSVIISDYIMPIMRGDALLVALHERSPTTVKIMLTGQSDLEGVKTAINHANLYRFLEKPFNNADLVLTIRSALNAFQLDTHMREQVQALQRELATTAAALQATEAELANARAGIP